MLDFIIEPNKYLHTRIDSFYSVEYCGFEEKGNPDYLNILKNTFCSYNKDELLNAANQLKAVIKQDLKDIFFTLNCKYYYDVIVCIVPRSKASFKPEQMLFHSTVSNVIDGIISCGHHYRYVNGSDFIKRHTDTRTTHLKYNAKYNRGDTPYPGITKDTCNISNEVHGRDILLIDDIYTKSINVDEDVIQALLDNGANNVFFYAVAKTKYIKRG